MTYSGSKLMMRFKRAQIGHTISKASILSTDYTFKFSVFKMYLAINDIKILEYETF